MLFAVAEPMDEPRHVERQKRLTEEDILDRLELLQAALVLPEDVWDVLVDILCPDTTEVPPLPLQPTRTLPGSEDRLKVMIARRDAGYQVFHPDDLTWESKIAERLGIAGCRLRNGVAERLGMPLVEQRHDGQHEVAATVAEGFTLQMENVIVVGKLQPAKRRAKPRREFTVAGGPQQLTLWEQN